MSLRIAFNENNYISQNTRYSQGSPEAAASGNFNVRNGSAQIVENSQDDKLMKRIGAIECSTCQSRKYVDGSDDLGVSFKAPAHVSPEGSGAAVMFHEQEHVSRESSKAQSEGRKVVSQSVQIYTDVCPECGRVYTSGGKTTTTTKSDNKDTDYFMDNMKNYFGKQYGKYIDIKL